MWPRASTPRRAGTPSGCRRRFATTPRRPATTIRPSLAAQRRCPSKTRASVLIESEPKLWIPVLTRFLHANRCPLRSKTLDGRFPAPSVANQIKRRAQRQQIGRFRHPHDPRGDAEQAVVVVVHAVEIEPQDRLRERLDRREPQQLGAAEILHAEPAG